MRTSALLAAVVAIGALSACGGGDAPAAETSEESDAVTVDVRGIAYEPSEVEVAAGATVTWVNFDEGVTHTVTSGAPQKQGVPGVSADKPARPDGVLDGELATDGEEFSYTFDDEGEYEYFCTVHAGMKGVVVVTSG